MKELGIQINFQSIPGGLRVHNRAARNQFGLVECHNVVATENGYEQYDFLPFPMPTGTFFASALSTIQWPDPRILQTENLVLAVHSDRIYKLDLQGGTSVDLQVYQMADSTQEFSIPLGRLWYIIPMFEHWILTNGECSIHFDNLKAITGGSNEVLGQSIVKFNSGGMFKGRQVICGIGNQDSFFFDTNLQKIINDDFNKTFTNMIADYSVDKNMVLWSNIGIGLSWLFNNNWRNNAHVDGGSYTNEYDTNDRFFYDLIKRGDLGWMPMPWEGEALHGLQLGEVFMIYGEGGISGLYNVIDPVPTLGRRDYNLTCGINNQGAIGGNHNKHLYLDMNGDLWYIRVGERGFPSNPELLGYREFFENDLDTQWVISFDSMNDQFFICNGVKTFVLGSNGLSTVDQIVTSVGHEFEKTVCLGGVFTGTKIRIVSDTVDFRASGLKTITRLEIISDKIGKYKLGVQYRYNDSTDWVESQLVQVNDEGVAYVNITARDFRIVIQASDLEDLYEVDPPDSVTIKYQQGDRRFARGFVAGGGESRDQ